MALRDLLLKLRIVSDTDKAKDDLRGSADAVERVGKAAGSARGRMQQLGDYIGNQLTGLTKRFVITLDDVERQIGRVVQAVRGWIDAANTQARAEKLLETNLRNVTGATDAQIAALKAQASALQNLTGYGDEATIQAQAFLATFGLTADAIALLTPRLLDMAEQQRRLGSGTVDLIGLAQQLGKAYADESAAGLRRYGVTLTATQEAQLNAATGMEKVRLLAEVLDANFRGAAEAVGGDFEGAMRKAQAAVGDLGEGLGRLALSTGLPQEITESTTALSVALTELADALAKESEAGSVAAVSTRAAAASMDVATAAANPMAAIIQGLGTYLDRLGFSWVGAINAMRDWVGASKEVNPEAQALAEATERVARGALSAEEAMGALTEQQTMLLAQTGEFGEVAWDAAESTDRLAAATDGLAASAEDAARALGTTTEALKTGLSAQDLGIIRAFDELRTRADLEGEEIGRAFALALARTSAQGLPALQQSWEQAREEGQVSIDEYSEGLDQVIKAQDRLATKTAGSVEDAARRMKEAWKEAFGELEDEVDGVTTAMDVLIARQEIIALRAEALAQAQRGEISAEELGQRMLELDRQRAEIDERRREAKLGQVDAEQRIADISAAREPTARELLRIALEEERAAQGTAAAVDAAYRRRLAEQQLREQEQSSSRGTTGDDGIRRVTVADPSANTRGGVQSAAAVQAQAVDMGQIVADAVAKAVADRLAKGFTAPVKAQITVDSGALGNADFARESLKRGVRYT